MQIIYKADNGDEFPTEAECKKHEIDTALYYHIVNNIKISGSSDSIYVDDVENYIRKNIAEINLMLSIECLRT